MTLNAEKDRVLHIKPVFGTCGRQEHHDIKIEELKVVKPPNGETDYV